MNELPAVAIIVTLVCLAACILYIFIRLEEAQGRNKALQQDFEQLEKRHDEQSKNLEHHLVGHRLDIDRNTDCQMKEVANLWNRITELADQIKAQGIEIIDANGIAISAKLDAEKAHRDTVAYSNRLYELIKELRPKVRRSKKRPSKSRRRK